MIQANPEIRVKLSDKLINIFLTRIKVCAPKINKSLAQQGKNIDEYPNMHFILCLNIEAYNSFVFYWNKATMIETEGIDSGPYSAQA